ncbi:MAG TPA: hypothetical protein VFG30_13830 [Polyangiales bacterium]|nr:hypothetical protein [Polyangiales bacterium]
MTRWEHIWAVEVLAAFAPAAEPRNGSSQPSKNSQLAPREGEVDYLRTFRRMHAGSTPLAGLGLRFALWMVALAPLWLLGRFATFSKLARAERTELLSRLLRHTNLVVRELALLLKLTAAFALLGTPSVRERSGYDKPQAAANVVREARRALPVFVAPAKRVDVVAPPPAFAINTAHDHAPTARDRVAS